MDKLLPAKQVGSRARCLRLRRAGFIHPIIIDGNHFYKAEEVASLPGRLAEAAERLLRAGAAGRRGRPGYLDLAGV